MMRWACCGLAVLASLALFATSGTTPDARAGDGWWGRLDEGEAVSLTDVMAEPQRYRDRTLTFFCIFHARENYFDPVRTPFNPKRHDNFSAWPDGTFVWEERGFQRDLPFLYIARNNAHRDELLALPMITRIEITGKVREISARGRPYIEVFSFRETGHRLGRSVVRAIKWGDNHARLGTQRGNQIAARSYRDALTPDLPPVYAMVVRKRLADALRRLGNDREADQVERGEILGGGSMPAPEPGAPVVMPPEEPFVRPPPVMPPSELPGTPAEFGTAPSAAPTVPQQPPGFVPDMPVKPLTPDSDLPGQPSGNPAAPDVLPPPRTTAPGMPSPRPAPPSAFPPPPAQPAPAPSPSPAPAPRAAPGLGGPPTGPLPALPPPLIESKGRPLPVAVPPQAFPPAPTLPATAPPSARPVAVPEPAAVPPKATKAPTKRREPLLPGVPPKRKPRLSGVK